MRANLATLVEEFRKNAGETGVIAHRGNRRYATTYGELAELAGRFAAELERRGVGPGERVVVWGANSAEWVGVFFGCLLRGVIAVPLDAAGSVGFAERVMRETAPRLVVGDAGLLVGLTEDAAIPRMALAGIAEHLPQEALYAASEAVRPETPFQIVFTSGTTAEPRGIVHTHRNVLATLEPIEREMAKYLRYERIVHPLRFLHSLPLSHVFGQFMGLWIPALLAAEIHFAEELEPARMTRLIRQERISVLVAVPRVLQLLRAHLLGRFPGLREELDGSDEVQGWNPVVRVAKRWWRYRRVHGELGWKFWAVISGGATLPTELERFWNRLGYALIQGYGMTETAALVTLNHPFHIAPGTIGKTLPGREVKIAEDGEILVRGAMLAESTWERGGLKAREGDWLATGDLAEKDAAGGLRFLGRKSDMIATAAGLNIHPADVEAALAARPGVRGCAVVGCELGVGAGAGPEPVAVVVSSGSDAELDAAVSAANRMLAEFQQIRRVLRWPEPQLPYTSTGKLMRRQVAAWACAQLTGVGSAAGGGWGGGNDRLLDLIAGVTGDAVAEGDTDHLRLSEDLHLDSLGRVQLLSALEQSFGVELEDDAVAAVETVGELRALVDAQVGGVPVGGAESRERIGAPVGQAEAEAGEQEQAVKREQIAAEDRYPRWPWAWPVAALRVMWIELAMRPLVWLLAAPRVRTAQGAFDKQERPDGKGNPNKAEPMLIVCNHVTAFDGALVLYALPFRVRRRVAAAMSGEMLLEFRERRILPGWGVRNRAVNLLAPAAYWLLTALFNVFPLPRARGFRRSFAHAGEAMDRGYSVLIFPEGSRSRDGRLDAFRPGIGLLAEESRAPMLPVALVGLYELSAAGGGGGWLRWFHAGRIEVRIGAMIPAADETSDAATLTSDFGRSVQKLLEG